MSEQFPQLEQPPIVEAVLHWKAPATESFERETLSTALHDKLPDYPTQKNHFETQVVFDIPVGEGSGSPTADKWGGWSGLRIESADRSRIAVFSNDGLLASRLTPYPGWDAFVKEVHRLWDVFIDLGKPALVEQLGLRFINRIPITSLSKLGNYLLEPPTRPAELSLTGFLYQSTFDAGQDGLFVNVIKTVQKEPNGNEYVILDIDVVHRHPIGIGDIKIIDPLLKKMRWLKNKVFFGLLQPSFVKSLEENSP